MQNRLQASQLTRRPKRNPACCCRTSGGWRERLCGTVRRRLRWPSEHITRSVNLSTEAMEASPLIKTLQIDRHIRALDSALSSHEASILLGLRAHTNPSSAVEPASDPVDGAIPGQMEGEDDEVIIGMGGGGARKKKGKRGKKGKKADAAVNAVAEEGKGEQPGPLFDLDVDP